MTARQGRSAARRPTVRPMCCRATASCAGHKATRLFKNVQRFLPDGTLEQMRRYGADVGMTARHIDEGLRLISSIILHTGRDLDQLTAEDVFHLRARPGARTARHTSAPTAPGICCAGRASSTARSASDAHASTS